MSREVTKSNRVALYVSPSSVPTMAVFLKGRSIDMFVISLLNVLERDEVGGVSFILGHCQEVPQDSDTSPYVDLHQAGGPYRDCGKYDGF